jgi:hypothetical protein
MNETDEYGECSSLYTEMHLFGMTAAQSAALEERIVAAVCRHYYLPPEAVSVLGYRNVSVHDTIAHASDLHLRGRLLYANHSHAVISLELRERTELVNVTAARADVPLNMDRLRKEFLDGGAIELGVDVDAIEIVLIQAAVQVDTHAPTPAPTPPPTPAPAAGAPDEVSTKNAGIFSYLMGSLPGGQDPSVGIGALASFGPLLVCGTAYATYVTYVRVQHPGRQKGAQSTNAVNNAAKPVTPKTKTTSPNTATQNTSTPTTATHESNTASTYENGRNPLPPDLEDGDEMLLGTKEVEISLSLPVEDVDVESEGTNMLPRSYKQLLTINDGERPAVFPNPQPRGALMNEFDEFVDADGNMVNIAELLPSTSKRLEAGEDVIHTDAQVEDGFRSMFSCAAPCATAPATLCSPCATTEPVAAVTVIASAGDAALTSRADQQS